MSIPASTVADTAASTAASQDKGNLTSLSTPLSHLDDGIVATNPQIVPRRVETQKIHQTTQIQPVNPYDSFWGEDPSVLLQKDRLVEFFPTADQTLPERVNSVSRLIIYISIALSIYQGKATAAHFGILLMAMIYFMYKNQTMFSLDKIEENDSNGNDNIESFMPEPQCIMPTAQNPYMNFLPGSMPGRAPACKGPGVQETASNLLDNQLFDDVDDLFSRNANQRLFRTMPETTGIPNREHFANWLIKGEPGCKTTGFCPPYEDLRVQKQLIPEDLEKLQVTGFSL